MLVLCPLEPTFSKCQGIILASPVSEPGSEHLTLSPGPNWFPLVANSSDQLDPLSILSSVTTLSIVSFIHLIIYSSTHPNFPSSQ